MKISFKLFCRPVIFGFLFSLIALQGVAQNTIYIGGNTVLVSRDTKFPIWVPGGTAVGTGTNVIGISATEYNIAGSTPGGNNLVFSRVLNITTSGVGGVSGVSGAVVWKLESVLLSPSGSSSMLISGASGVAGATGPQGVTGPSGVAGATGASGPTGASGVSGPTGPSGATGATGASGAGASLSGTTPAITFWATSNTLGSTTAGSGMYWLTSSGYLGIGTTSPKAPLHVAVATSTSPYTSSAITRTSLMGTGVGVYHDYYGHAHNLPYGGYGYIGGGINGISYNNNLDCDGYANESTCTIGLNSVDGVVAITADGDIVGKGTITCASNLVYSDERIKNIKGTSDGVDDLNSIDQIRIVDYTMKDNRLWGGKQFKKVVAQQVEQVYPQAVSSRVEYIPDLYVFATKAEKTDGGYLITVEKDLPKLKTEKIRLELEKVGTVEAGFVKRVNDKQILVTADNDITKGELFVYGQQVTDFKQVDYDALSMLNISAVQELHKLVLAQQETIKSQQNQLNSMKAENSSVKEDMDKMKASIEVLQQIVGAKSQK